MFVFQSQLSQNYPSMRTFGMSNDELKKFKSQIDKTLQKSGLSDDFRNFLEDLKNGSRFVWSDFSQGKPFQINWAFNENDLKELVSLYKSVPGFGFTTTPGGSILSVSLNMGKDDQDKIANCLIKGQNPLFGASYSGVITVPKEQPAMPATNKDLKEIEKARKAKKKFVYPNFPLSQSVADNTSSEQSEATKQAIYAKKGGTKISDILPKHEYAEQPQYSFRQADPNLITKETKFQTDKYGNLISYTSPSGEFVSATHNPDLGPEVVKAEFLKLIDPSGRLSEGADAAAKAVLRSIFYFSALETAKKIANGEKVSLEDAVNSVAEIILVAAGAGMFRKAMNFGRAMKVFSNPEFLAECKSAYNAGKFVSAAEYNARLYDMFFDIAENPKAYAGIKDGAKIASLSMQNAEKKISIIAVETETDAAGGSIKQTMTTKRNKITRIEEIENADGTKTVREATLNKKRGTLSLKETVYDPEGNVITKKNEFSPSGKQKTSVKTKTAKPPEPKSVEGGGQRMIETTARPTIGSMLGAGAKGLGYGAVGAVNMFMVWRAAEIGFGEGPLPDWADQYVNNPSLHMAHLSDEQKRKQIFKELERELAAFWIIWFAVPVASKFTESVFPKLFTMYEKGFEVAAEGKEALRNFFSKTSSEIFGISQTDAALVKAVDQATDGVFGASSFFSKISANKQAYAQKAAAFVRAIGTASFFGEDIANAFGLVPVLTGKTIELPPYLSLTRQMAELSARILEDSSTSLAQDNLNKEHAQSIRKISEQYSKGAGGAGSPFLSDSKIIVSSQMEKAGLAEERLETLCSEGGRLSVKDENGESITFSSAFTSAFLSNFDLDNADLAPESKLRISRLMYSVYPNLAPLDLDLIIFKSPLDEAHRQALASLYGSYKKSPVLFWKAIGALAENWLDSKFFEKFISSPSVKSPQIVSEGRRQILSHLKEEQADESLKLIFEYVMQGHIVLGVSGA